MFIVHWFLTPPSLISLHFTFSRYLAFLAADWSGLSVPIRSPSPLCPPVPVDDVAVFSLWFLSSLSFLVLSPFSLVFGGLCPFPSSRLSASSFFARFPSFPFDSSGLDWSGFSGLSLSFFSPLCCRLFCFVGLCSLASLVTLGCCAWSFWPQTGPDFQRHPLPPPSPLFNFPLPLLCFSLGP